VVQLAELVRRLERPVVPDGLRPRDRLRARDVAAALRALLLVAGRGDQVARVLLWAAHVDERLPLGADRFPDRVPVGANRLVPVARRVLAGGGLRRVLGRVAPLVEPLLAAAVEDADVF